MSPAQIEFRNHIMAGQLHYAKHKACHPVRNMPVLIRLSNQVLKTFRLDPLPEDWPAIYFTPDGQIRSKYDPLPEGWPAGS
jgi:hypothetical protein